MRETSHHFDSRRRKDIDAILPIDAHKYTPETQTRPVWDLHMYLHGPLKSTSPRQTWQWHGCLAASPSKHVQFHPVSPNLRMEWLQYTPHWLSTKVRASNSGLQEVPHVQDGKPALSAVSVAVSGKTSLPRSSKEMNSEQSLRSSEHGRVSPVASKPVVSLSLFTPFTHDVPGSHG